MDIKEMMKSLSGSDPDMIKQCEQYWKMLDDMSEKDPNAYKTFIDSNMKNGKEHFAKEKEVEKEKHRKIIDKSDYQFTIQLNANLDTRSIGPEDSNENNNNENAFLKNEFVKEKNKAENESLKDIPSSATVFLNFIKSEHVKGPLNKEHKDAEVGNPKTWAIIPFTLSEAQTENKATALGGVGEVKIYHNLVLNDKLLVLVQVNRA